MFYARLGDNGPYKYGLVVAANYSSFQLDVFEFFIRINDLEQKLRVEQHKTKYRIYKNGTPFYFINDVLVYVYCT